MSKKILAVALAAAMILGLASVAFAASFTDTVGHEREAAIGQLAGLGLLNGYPDGTFRPDNAITRAEFAKVMVYAMGLKDAAEMLSGVPVVFTDVEANHWAAGYISVASSQEIVKGYPDGTFGPQNNVTYAEVITMILRALGYGPVLDNQPWPTAYLAKAAELKLTKGISFLANSAATRGDVAALVANALTEPKLIPIAWGPDGKPTQYGKSKGEDLDTLLHDMGATSVDGWLIDSPELFSNDGKTIKLAGKESMKLVEGTDCTGLIGHYVRVWLNDDNKVFFVEDITPESDVREGEYVGVITEKDEDGNDVEVGVTIEVDDEKVDLKGNAVFYNYIGPAVGTKDLEDAEITVVFDGDTPKYAVAKEYVWGVVETASETYERITFSVYGDGGRSTLRVDDYDITWYGAAQSFDELEEDDVVEYIVNTKYKKAVFVVTRNAVEGEFSRLTSSKARIGDTDYSYVEDHDGVDDSNLGYDVIALLNKDGEIVAIKKVTGPSTPSTLAVVVDLGEQRDAFGNNTVKARLFLTDGTKAVLDLASEVSIDGTKVTVDSLSDLNLAEGDVITYKTNSSGEVTSITTKVKFSELTDPIDINKTRSLVNALKVSSDTVVFNIVTAEETGAFKSVEVLTSSALLDLDDKKDVHGGTQLYGSVVADGAWADIVVVKNAVTAESDALYGMVYGSYQARVGNDVEWILRILVDGVVTDYPATFASFDIDNFANETIVEFTVKDGELATAVPQQPVITSIAGTVYKARIADVDVKNGIITVEVKSDDTGEVLEEYYLFIDEDTLYYDVAGSNRKSITLEDLSTESEVDVYAPKRQSGETITVLVVKSY